MKKIVFAIYALVMGIVFTSCEDEKRNPTPPTFKGFTVAPSTVAPGDTITISAIYDSKGEFVGAPKCTWKITLDTLSAVDNTYKSYTYSKQVKASISDETLFVKYVIPTSAKAGQTATCNLDIAFDNYIDATNIGQAWKNPTQEGYAGKFNDTTVKSTLYSHTSGSVTFKID